MYTNYAVRIFTAARKRGMDRDGDENGVEDRGGGKINGREDRVNVGG
jgi:hypothetical protein